MGNNLTKIAMMLTLFCIMVFAQEKGSFKDTRDGKTYKTVKIGDQVWMAENLNYAAKDSKCYANKPANCEKYGRLYDEKNIKNVCPTGWHLPMEEEWDVLYSAVGGLETAIRVLKSKSGWNDDKNFNDGGKIPGNGEDKFGFAALPGGTYGWAGECGEDDECYGFSFNGYCGFFGSISPTSNRHIGGISGLDYYAKFCSNSGMGMSDYGSGKDFKPVLLSVRCLQGTAEETIAEFVKKAEAEKAKSFNPKINYGSMTDARDKITYRTVKIGTQTWMAENLNYNTKGSKCNDNNPANCAKYGRLYDWKTAKNACPSGWHLPIEAEWDALTSYVEDSKNCTDCAFNHLKTMNGWKTYEGKSDNGTDTFGFSALPSGGSNGYYDANGDASYWWSASENKGDSNGIYQCINCNYSEPSLLSVRCIYGTVEEAIAELVKKAESEKAMSFNPKINYGSMTDTRDKTTYRTTKIGNQTWMAENLNYNADNSECYRNNPANCAKYGRLYNWEMAKNVCPSGWHLPSKAEWEVLTAAVGGENTEGKHLKSKVGWNKGKDGSSRNGLDTYGFSALPGDYSYVHWWSASENRSSTAYSRYLGYENENLIWKGNYKSNMSYVRCLRGTAEEAIAELVKKAEAEKTKSFNPKINYGSITDTRDKTTYRTVKIGNQTWMAENLNYNANGSKCYDNQENNCQKYGRLYNGSIAKTVCPSGWHLPSKAEWDILTAAVGGENKEGKHLKAKSGWNKNGNGLDTYGFSASPGGIGSSDNNFSSTSELGFSDIGLGGYWWSINETSDNGNNDRNAKKRVMKQENIRRDSANNRYIMLYDNELVSQHSSMSGLLSIRCLQD